MTVPLMWIEVGAYHFLVEENQPKKKIGAVMPAPFGATYIGIITSRTHMIEDFCSGPYVTVDEAKHAIEKTIGITC